MCANILLTILNSQNKFINETQKGITDVVIFSISLFIVNFKQSVIFFTLKVKFLTVLNNKD